MAEFCVDCWNKIMESNDPPQKFIISRELDLCEECGEWKRVIIRVKGRYLAAERLREFVQDLRKRQR